MTAISGSFTTLMRMIAALKRLFHTLTKLINTSSHLNTLLHSISAPPLLPLQLCLHPLTFHLLSPLIFSSFFYLFLSLFFCLTVIFPPFFLLSYSPTTFPLTIFILFLFLSFLSLVISSSSCPYLSPCPYLITFVLFPLSSVIKLVSQTIYTVLGLVSWRRRKPAAQPYKPELFTLSN